jgi:DHA1 family bicyclomycin/chloramphenicol resistance-like MFS transporter
LKIGRFLQLAIVLGLITAVGPFAIDMYLPALPSIGGALHATPAAVLLKEIKDNYVSDRSL